MARATLAWFGVRRQKPEYEYTVVSPCPTCGRRHITVFKLRHRSDSFFTKVGDFYRYARHFDFKRLRVCPNSAKSPQW